MNINKAQRPAMSDDLKIVQADNGKAFKGALLILLRKYGIQVVNGAPRSPQIQGLVEQANGVVETKLRA